MGNGKRHIFVSHSSKDVDLIRFTELAFKNGDIEPYFAAKRMEGKNPADKIVEAIAESIGLFAFITPNVVNDKHTRDWVNFEFGVAKANGIPIFGWMDKKVSEEESYPELMKNITDYDKFNSCDDVDCCRVIESVLKKAHGLSAITKKKEDVISQQSNEKMISMAEAQNIAEQFVLTKKPNYTNMELTSIEPKDGLWIVKGTILKSSPKSFGSEGWTITIKEKEVIACEFKAGLAVSVGKRGT